MIEKAEGAKSPCSIHWDGRLLVVRFSGVMCELWAWRLAAAVVRELSGSCEHYPHGTPGVLVDLTSAEFDAAVAFEVMLRKLAQHGSSSPPLAVLVDAYLIAGRVKAMPVRAALQGFTVGVFSERERAARYLLRQVRALPGLQPDQRTGAVLRTG